LNHLERKTRDRPQASDGHPPRIACVLGKAVCPSCPPAAGFIISQEKYTMSTIDFDTLLNQQVAAARARGIALPALLVLARGSPAARAVYQELTGRELEPPAAGEAQDDEWGPLEAVDLERAAALLRRHAGPGGALLADHLADPALRADYALIILVRAGLQWTLFRDGEPLAGGNWSYDRPPKHARPPSQLAADPAAVVQTVAMSRGPVRVYGRNGPDLALTAALVGMVSSWPGSVELPAPGQPGRVVSMPVTWELVRDFLTRVLADKPHAIAEAVRALDRHCPGPAKWLRRHLRDRQPGLWRSVREELTGEG
jgi:hypothetical protein